MPKAPVTRQARKERTRTSILDSALRLSEEGGLAKLSLRSVAKDVGIVPAAIYRHFASVEELGLALLDDSFGAMRQTMREVRRDTDLDSMIEGSIAILAKNVADRRAHFLFLARERIAGPPLVRDALHRQMELFELELAMDLSRLPQVNRWPSEDVRTLAALIVTTVTGLVEALVSSPGDRSSRQHDEEAVARTQKQLRMIIVGAANWEPPQPEPARGRRGRGARSQKAAAPAAASTGTADESD
ncbi:TetR family transcriptional regulator [Knoellia remsis]|uniref:TetR family transcriptional regulator n=1 Tax=Knoellia remsis TaxID=407159 RepID=A0A2T0UI57_9MICO|nr:TetR family transcriptional regulator [Knoellia remsis]PRY57546.1 TetR family transcriptional regulator [Knoellia remsis]